MILKKKKKDQVIPLPKILTWFPIVPRIKFKLHNIIHNVLHDRPSLLLQTHLTPYSVPSSQNVSSSSWNRTFPGKEKNHGIVKSWTVTSGLDKKP